MEALQGHRVVDVACGSGDAQTLCLTDDDTVWSWGDGDYGKLGRGGSDGCKVPMKVFPLTLLGPSGVRSLELRLLMGTIHVHEPRAPLGSCPVLCCINFTFNFFGENIVGYWGKSE